MNTIMKSWTLLRKVFQPLPIFTLLGFGVSAVVWFYGDRLGAYETYPFLDERLRAWIASAFLLLGLFLSLVLAVRMFGAWSASKAADAQREPTIEENEALAMSQVFQRVCDVIRRRWSDEGDPIYTLPWYLVLGTNGSGKTALIDNSELRLPIDHEIRAALSDLNETEAAHFAEWRVAGNEAVLIELSGKFFVRHEDRTPSQSVLWQRFLAGLQQVRPRRPLNGVILTVDLVDFAEMDVPARDAFASNVRRILDDLVEDLSTRMTIHVVFTKVDLIAGFLDLFENLEAGERNSLLGFQFSIEENESWLEQFDAQYADFLSRLHRLLNRRLSTLKDVQRRQEAFAFARSFFGLQKAFRSFLENALQPDNFSTTPLFRGVYFAAPRLENAPRNLFLESVGERYSFPPPLYAVPKGASRPCFSSRIIKDVVIKEAGLAGNSRRAEERYTRFAGGLALASVLLALSASVFWFAEYRENLAKARTVRDLIVAQQALPGATNDMDGQLNAFRAAVVQFGDYRDVNPAIAELTLYKGREIGALADSAYRRVLHQQFVPSLVDRLQGKIAYTCPRGSDEQLNLLRLLLMMGTPERRSNPALEAYFGSRWQIAYPTDALMQDRLTSHLDYALTVDPQPYKIDEELVRNVRTDLARVTPYRRLYASVKALADRQLPNALEFRSAVGATFDIVYTGQKVSAIATGDGGVNNGSYCPIATEAAEKRDPFEIDRIYTNTQFHNFFVPQIQTISRAALEDLWILGRPDGSANSEADLKVLTERLREIYVEDYIRTWRNALKAMKVRPFGDLRDADQILKGVSGADSPIRRIAGLVTENTVIYPPETISPDTKDGAIKLKFDPNREAGLRINEEFRAIHRMLAGEENGTQPNIEEIEKSLADLHDYIQVVRDAPNSDAKALEVALARANLQGSDPIYVVKRLAERTPAPFDDHLRFIADESWRIILAAAADELSRKWNTEIYSEYQQLIAGRYPFDRESGDDLPLADFQEFFGPQGTLHKFYKANLAVFVDEATGQPRDIDGQSLPVDVSFTSTVRQAVRITRTFFNDEGNLSVRFTAQPVGLSGNLSRAQLNFEGQLVVATHGAARPVRIVWPNSIDSRASSRVDFASVSRTGRSGGRQFDGPWSWLRLYDSAAKTNLADNSVDIAFGNSFGQSARFRIRAEGQVNPFFNSPLSSFALPSGLRGEVVGQ